MSEFWLFQTQELGSNFALVSSYYKDAEIDGFY